MRRRRLLQLMTDAQQAKLMLVGLPAGSGKTTLLTDWIEAQRNQRPQWPSLVERLSERELEVERHL